MVSSLAKGGSGGLKLLGLILLSTLLPVRPQDSTTNVTLWNAGQDVSFSKAGRSYSSQSDSVCGGNITAFDGNVLCVGSISFTTIGHCMSYIDANTIIPFNNSFNFKYEGYILSRCPFFAGTHIKKLFIPYNNSNDKHKFNELYCGKIHSGSHRTGFLCSQCTDGYEMDVLSPSYECRYCTSNSSSSKIVTCLKILGSTLLPLTVLFFIVMIFHVSLTSAPTNGYLFFSHAITIQMNVLIIETAWSTQLAEYVTESNAQSLSKKLSIFLLLPHFIWTFDFGYILDVHAPCLGNKFTIMHVFFSQYIYALYPMILIILSLVLIELHGRNCKLVVVLWKPFCFLCVRLRRNWEVKTSLIDAFASFILLSYSKLVGVSLALVCPNPAYAVNGSIVYTSLHYGISVQYLSTQHLPFFIIGIIGLIFGLLPPLLLLFYPFRWFQKILNTLRLNRFQSLYIFVDAFQGCYKNGTGGSKERRYFAGLYFAFRFIVLMAESVTYFKLQTSFIFLVGAYTSFLLTIAILQPYRKDFFNYLDALFFAIMAVANANMVYVMGYAENSVGFKLPVATWPITYVLLLLPGMYMCFYIVYWVFTRFRTRCHYQRSTHLRFYQSSRQSQDSDREETEVSDGHIYRSPRHSSLSDFSCEMPDRLLNPHHYEVDSRTKVFLCNQSLSSGSEASEQSPRVRRMESGSEVHVSEQKRRTQSKYGAF